MGARLPGVDALGARPTPQPGRGYAGGGGQGYQPVAPTGDRQLASAYEGMGEAVYRGGGVLADSALKAKEKEDRYQEAAAHSAFLRKKVELDNSFDDDPDYETYGKRYEEGIKRAREDAAAMIKDPDRRAMFDLKAGDASVLGMEQIGKKAKAKEKDAGQGYLLDTINGNLDAAMRTPDEKTREQLLDSINSSIVAAREKGHIDRLKEAELRQKYGQEFAERSLRALPPEEQLKRLLPPQATPSQAAAGGDYRNRVIQAESGGDPKAVNPSGAKGLYQFMPETAKQYGLDDPTDPVKSGAAFDRFTADNRAVLTKSLGREPTDAELYLAHQQGAGGASALLRDPSRPAVEALADAYGGNRAKAAKAITQNGGSLSMTAGEFAAKQYAHFDKTPGEVQVASLGNGYDFQAKTNTVVDYLPADKRMLMIEQAQNKLKENDTRFRAEVNDRYQNALVDIRANGQTSVVSDGEIRSAYRNDPLKAEALVKNLREEKTFYGARQAVKFTSPQEDELLLKTWTPQGENAATTAPRYEALVRAVQEKRRALAEDPGGYVRQTSPEVQAKFAEAEADPKKLPAALEMSDQVQSQLGVPPFDRRLLGKGQAETMVRQVMDLKGEKMADAMQGMAAQYGRYWPQVFRELQQHKLPDNLSVLATIDNPVARVQMANTLKAETERKGSSRDLAGEDAKDIDKDVAVALEPFRRSLSLAPNGTQVGDRYEDSVKLLAYRYAVQGMKGSQAAKQAAQDVALERYDFAQSGPAAIRAPKGRMDQAQQWAKLAAESLKPEDIQAPPARPGETLTIQQRESAYAQAARRGFWITNENDDGWVLMDPAGQPVMKRDGTRVGFRYDEIPAVTAKPAPTSLDIVAP